VVPRPPHVVRQFPQALQLVWQGRNNPEGMTWSHLHLPVEFEGYSTSEWGKGEIFGRAFSVG
jgi:hypothetical protein